MPSMGSESAQSRELKLPFNLQLDHVHTACQSAIRNVFEVHSNRVRDTKARILQYIPANEYTSRLIEPLIPIRTAVQQAVQIAQEKGYQFIHHVRSHVQLQLLGSQQRRTQQLRISRPVFASMSSSLSPFEQHENSDNVDIPEAKEIMTLAMSLDQVAERLSDIPVYTVSNSNNEFVLVTDIDGSKSLGILCIRQEDAHALLRQIKDREPKVGRGARVVEVQLDHIYKLQVEGIAFRFLPDPNQVKNAIEVNSSSGPEAKRFQGVPVFQSTNLILKRKGKSFCPIFFSKEDLETTLVKASRKQRRINPSVKVGNTIVVGHLESVLESMQGAEEDSVWGTIMFVPPGMDAISHLDKAAASSGNETVLAEVQKSETPSGPTIIC